MLLKKPKQNLKLVLRNDRAGFTFVEIALAALLLVTVAAGILSAFITAYNWVRPESAVASNLMRSELEGLYEYITQGWDTSPLALGGPYTQITNVNSVPYTITYTVTPVAGVPSDTGYRQVTMTVTWPDS